MLFLSLFFFVGGRSEYGLVYVGVDGGDEFVVGVAPFELVVQGKGVHLQAKHIDGVFKFGACGFGVAVVVGACGFGGALCNEFFAVLVGFF